MPATPTSVQADGREPVGARGRPRTRSATGPSAVPAAAITTRSGRVGAAGRQTIVVPDSTAPGWAASTAARLLVGRPGQHDRIVAAVQQLAHDGDALLGRLARAVDRLGHALPQRPVVVDAGEAEVGERQPASRSAAAPASSSAGGDGRQQPARAVGSTSLFCRGVAPPDRAGLRVGFLGPLGHVHRAGAPQPARPGRGRAGAAALDARSCCRPWPTAVVDVGFVAIENSIEGTVNLTQDALIFNHDLLIQREVVLDVEQCLLGRPGTAVSEVKVVLSIPVATAQCQRFLSEHLPGAELRAANSTAEAARHGGRGRTRRGGGHRAPRSPASCTASRCWPRDIADHDGNQTRFVVVGRDGVPAPTGPRQDLASSSTSGPTSRAASSRSCRSSRRGASTSRSWRAARRRPAAWATTAS